MGNNYCTAIVFIVCVMKCFRTAFDVVAYLIFFFITFYAGIKILRIDQVD